MSHMQPEDFVARLKDALPDGLRSVILYGSAAAGDHVARRSDYNVLVVTAELGVAQLKALCGPSAAWVRAGNPAPLLFTVERLKRSADVFPVEILDIKQSRRVLFGEDVVAELDVSRENLRLEIEHELKGKLIQLRERYLATRGKAKAVGELMCNSLSTFLVLFRAALRLYQDEVPARKLDVLDELGKHVQFDAEVFRTVDALRTGARKVKADEADGLFEKYLATVDEVTDRVDSFIRGEGD